VDRLVSATEQIIAKPDEIYLIDVFETKVNGLDFLTQEQKATYIQENRAALSEYFVPAYRSFINEIKALKGTGKNEKGLAGLEKGKAYYTYLLKVQTGTDKSVEEVIKAIDDRLKDVMMDIVGLMTTDPDVMTRYSTALPTDTPDPAAILSQLEKDIGADYPAVSKITYRISDVHPSMADSTSPAFYFIPPLDASDENSIYLNQGKLGDYTSVFSTLAHEGYPGHLYQTNYFFDNTDSLFHKSLSFNGYVEGWAHYIENLSYAYLVPKDENLVKLLELDSLYGLLFQCRIDIGIHYEGWDKEKLYNYVSNMGYDRTASDELYVFMLDYAGQTLKYGVGNLEMLELREYAETELGSKFDQKAFHKAILDIGPAPFSVVRTAVEAYVKGAK
ncbi:DUF885 domain-containing protein, partial [Eubacteriales bacterium OttesenSCG-928-M02]|nr:DUF885 domain-containing protein [Eubacteriales bacterium OttesenSCG-928-M02]